MKRGFTLIELLVVVVVIVTLMAVTFRLGGAGADSTYRARTVNKMQRLENCLSGYYAAYGSYPPVGMHGSRDYTYEVNPQGIQQVKNDRHWSGKIADHWDAVDAACRSQPVGMCFPFANADIKDYIDQVSNILMEKANSSESQYSSFSKNEALKHGFSALVDDSKVSGKHAYSDWSDVQVFKLGLMSYLLPRFLVIFNVPSGKDNPNTGFNTLFSAHKQWTMNNELPCDFVSGEQYSSWNAVIGDMSRERWKIAALPSQAVCARWMPNLEGVVAGSSRSFYGVNVFDSQFGAYAGGVSTETYNPTLYSAGDSQGGSGYSDQYILDSMTVKDGWGNEFYYYSPTPHQSYTLWSAGPNGKTFPPWVTDEEIRDMQEDRSTVQQWMADDIMHMQN